jgi:hypothetical protein
MDNPFPPVAKPQDALASQRRTTRIDFVTTVLLSGRDASGIPFREFTQTATVNLHGCRVRTSYRILVGMLLTVECPKAGVSSKGVCVKVWDATPGAAGHEIAIQLVRPQNLWGVPNPPPDWEVVAKAIAQAQAAAEHPARPAPAESASLPPARATAAPGRAEAASTSPLDAQLVELEKRSSQLMDSVLEIIRNQSEEVIRICLEEFRQQVNALIRDSEGQLRQGLQQSYEESVAALIGLRSDLMDQMAERSAQLIQSAEETLRTHLSDPSNSEDNLDGPPDRFRRK